MDKPETKTATHTISADSGIGALLIIARFHDIAVDPQQLAHRYGKPDKPLDSNDLVRSLRDLGLKTRLRSATWSHLQRLRIPVILELKNGRFCVLARASDDTALIQIPGQPRARKIPRNEIEPHWTGRIIAATQRVDQQNAEQRFGIGWFIQALSKYRSIVREILLASFFVQLFALVTPLMFQIIIDKVLTHQSMSTLDVLILALAVVSLFEVLLGALRSYTMAHTSNRLDVELGIKLFRHLISLPLSYFESRRVGDTIARMRELENVRNFLTGSAVTLLLDMVFTVIFLAVMFYYSPFLTLIVLLTLPLFFLASLILTPMLRGKLDDKFARNAENQSFLVETINGIETLKTSAAEPHVQRHWENRLASYVATAFNSSQLANLTAQIINFISKGSIVLVLWLGAKLVMEGELSVGQLIAFNMLAARVNAPILRIAQIWQEFQQTRISLHRLADILDAPAEPVFTPGRTSPTHLEGGIRFDHVSFRYRDDGPEVLRDVNFTIEPGSVVGIVGVSGSGKTTLVKLIQRLYVPTRGRVLIDGIDMALIDASWLRRQIGVVAQDSVLFNRSVRENIAYAAPGLDNDAIMQAARLAGAHEFILELPDGYDTLIGERGNMLSAGQRQRIAIARALVTNPRLLIFDEATSALDYESEMLIRNNMRRICANRTVIIVAHRLSTVRHADRILTLEEGRITEQGSHEELLQADGRYAALYRIQEGQHEAL